MNDTSSVRRSLFAIAFTAAALASIPRAALAQEHAGSLPRQAYAACESKSEGGACTMQQSGPHGRTFQGVCSAERASSQLACRPAPPKPRS